MEKKTEISSGTVHLLPEDLKDKILSTNKLLENWEKLSPLARNEWICWIEDAKKSETRLRRIDRLFEDILKGKKRPCCWPGCTHRNVK